MKCVATGLLKWSERTVIVMGRGADSEALGSAPGPVWSGADALAAGAVVGGYHRGGSLRS